MANNPLLEIKKLGQSVWIDNLSRPMLQTGVLKNFIEQDGICGLTSNPTIFKNAMTGSDAYDAQIRELVRDGKVTKDVYEALAIDDIRGAADLLRPVFEESGGRDGFVSLEVSPHLAKDTEGTLAEARRLWKTVDRPNLMIKIPGNPEGIPAIEAALVDGINVNVTLLFSLSAYKQVIVVYFNAVRTRQEKKLPMDQLASVASFFISRIDVKVDRMLQKLIDEAKQVDAAKALLGKTAVANAKLAYQLWKELFSSDDWKELERAGARVQKPLWASTSTKNPSYPDVLYVEPLIGPQTVNTMPDETIQAFRDHGKAACTIEERLEEAGKVQLQLTELGINLDRVTDDLMEEGIQKFVTPFDELFATLEQKRK